MLTLDIIVTAKMNARNILHHVRVVPDAKTIGLALTVSAKTGSMEIVSLAVTSMNVMKFHNSVRQKQYALTLKDPSVALTKLVYLEMDSHVQILMNVAMDRILVQRMLHATTYIVHTSVIATQVILEMEGLAVTSMNVVDYMSVHLMLHVPMRMGDTPVSAELVLLEME